MKLEHSDKKCLYEDSEAKVGSGQYECFLGNINFSDSLLECFPQIEYSDSLIDDSGFSFIQPRKNSLDGVLEQKLKE